MGCNTWITAQDRAAVKKFFDGGSLLNLYPQWGNGAGMRHFCAKNGKRLGAGQKQAIDMR
jgi:hypothetical protein